MSETLAEGPRAKRPVPTVLSVVAALFLLGGIWSAAFMVHNLMAAKWATDPGVLGIPAFFGLRKLSRGWRTYALFMLWVVFIVAPIVVIFCVGSTLLVRYKVLEVPEPNDLPSVWTYVVAAAAFLLALWQYRILTRPDIRGLFIARPPGTSLVGEGLSETPIVRS